MSIFEEAFCASSEIYVDRLFGVDSAATFANDLGFIRLSLIEGDVQIVVQDTTDWTEATINLPMNKGDRLWVSDNSNAKLLIRLKSEQRFVKERDAPLF